MKRAGVEIAGIFETGFECYGVTIGSDNFVHHYLTEKAEEIKETVKKTCELLTDDLQALWTLLSSSIAHKLGYHLSLQYPSDIIPVAQELDMELWSMLE